MAVAPYVSPKVGFMTLPPELRLEIYAYLRPEDYESSLVHPLLAVSMQIRCEAGPVLFGVTELQLIDCWSVNKDDDWKMALASSNDTYLRWDPAKQASWAGFCKTNLATDFLSHLGAIYLDLLLNDYRRVEIFIKLRKNLPPEFEVISTAPWSEDTASQLNQEITEDFRKHVASFLIKAARCSTTWIHALANYLKCFGQSLLLPRFE